MKVLYVDDIKTKYICSENGLYMLVIPNIRYVMKSKDIWDLVKWGDYENVKDAPDSLERELNDIIDSPLILVDNRLSGTIVGPMVRNEYDLTEDEAKEFSQTLNEYFK